MSSGSDATRIERALATASIDGDCSSDGMPCPLVSSAMSCWIDVVRTSSKLVLCCESWIPPVGIL
jgi:hypothetical protein